MSTPPSKKSQPIALSDLLFDPRNPRLPTAKTNSPESAVFHYMLEEGKVTDLMLSIGQQDYFTGEPLMAIASEAQPGKYEVLEGNRRLAALKLLADPSLAPIKQTTVAEISAEADFRPSEVPVIVYDARKDILHYLGYRHITGVDEWDSLAKARYLNELLSLYAGLTYEEQLKVLARTIGSKPVYVHKLLSGYALYKEIEARNFFGIKSLSEEDLSFSVLTTALSYKGLAEYVGMPMGRVAFDPTPINFSRLEELTEWMFKESSEGRTRLGESRNLRVLNAVVLNPRALKAFKEDNRTLEEARLLSDEPKQIFSKAIQTSLRRLKDAQDQSHLVKQPTKHDLDGLSELRSMAKDLHSLMKGKLDNAGDEDEE